MITLTIPGRPVPAKRMTQRSKWTPAAQRSLAYQRLVAQYGVAAVRPRPLAWRFVAVDVTVYLKVNGKGELPGNRGDWDNYAKSVCDGLQYGEVFANDRAIIDGSAHIRPCSSLAEERAEVILKEAIL